MAELKTKPTEDSVDTFLATVADEEKRRDSLALVDLMSAATGAKPVLWGSSIIGFGDYHYRSPATGREGDWFVMGFSPRKQALTLYLMAGLNPIRDLLDRLGPHKTGKGCLYIKRLRDVDSQVLAELIQRSKEINP